MSKKFILFIVEGKNDEREINAILHTSYFSQYREKYNPFFWTKNGDLTTANDVTPKNIVKKLNDIVLNFRRHGVPFSNISIQDIQEIIQIVDLDGAFIPLDNIVRGEKSSFCYTDDSIITSNVDGARGRNKKKAEILRKLVDIKQIDNIPYSIYFASCNMDHLLFNRIMPTQQEKCTFSYEFQMLCQNHPEELSNSLFKPDIAASGSFFESWSNIQNDCQSLHRHTNFNLFFGDDAKNIK